MKKAKMLNIRRSRPVSDERGFTLLEYCAGAAVLLGVVWVAFSAMGQNVSGLIESIGQWASDRQTEINNSGGGAAGGNNGGSSA